MEHIKCSHYNSVIPMHRFRLTDHVSVCQACYGMLMERCKYDLSNEAWVVLLIKDMNTLGYIKRWNDGTDGQGPGTASFVKNSDIKT
jgi:hypothetical protein